MNISMTNYAESDYQASIPHEIFDDLISKAFWGYATYWGLRLVRHLDLVTISGQVFPSAYIASFIVYSLVINSFKLMTYTSEAVLGPGPQSNGLPNWMIDNFRSKCWNCISKGKGFYGRISEKFCQTFNIKTNSVHD